MCGGTQLHVHLWSPEANTLCFPVSLLAFLRQGPPLNLAILHLTRLDFLPSKPPGPPVYTALELELHTVSPGREVGDRTWVLVLVHPALLYFRLDHFPTSLQQVSEYGEPSEEIESERYLSKSFRFLRPVKVKEDKEVFIM